uniref:Uncharacterized protein n=1 Tax=Rhizophora mucronata TaxID=61149 RepID=A0A2P2R4D6_RHIMU
MTVCITFKGWLVTESSHVIAATNQEYKKRNI